jgi:hypothetical protein
MDSRVSIAPDLKWGLGWGLWLAGGFGLLGSALFLLQGTVLGHPSRFSFPLVILGYLAMGILGGLLAGLLRPLARSKLGATIMGVVIGIPVYAMAIIVAVGPKEFLSPPGLLSTLTLGTVIGGFCGRNSWSRRRH